jgi:hypothetical protein
MPELCRFYGIIIRMFWSDHPPPHFHAIYGEHEAIVEIATSEIIGGYPLALAALLANGSIFTVGSSWNDGNWVDNPVPSIRSIHYLKHVLSNCQ